jgi:hypothetical protein
MVALVDETARLSEDIARLAEENARLRHANLVQQRAMLERENVKLQLAATVNLAAPGLLKGPPGLDAPPGLEAAVQTPRAPPGMFQSTWDPVTAANASMAAMIARSAQIGSSITSQSTDCHSMTSSLVSSSSVMSSAASLMDYGFDFREPVKREFAGKTTVMLRNIPNNYTRDLLIELLDAHGAKPHYNMVYLPIDFASNAGFGYAFVNFVAQQDAEAFMNRVQGFRSWSVSSEKVLEATWSSAHQGIDSHIARYRNSPVMHASVPDDQRPALFKEGVRIPFPAPTKKLKAPRPRNEAAVSA